MCGYISVVAVADDRRFFLLVFDFILVSIKLRLRSFLRMNDFFWRGESASFIISDL